MNYPENLILRAGGAILAVGSSDILFHEPVLDIAHKIAMGALVVAGATATAYSLLDASKIARNYRM